MNIQRVARQLMCFVAVLGPTPIFAQDIAITIDDLPYVLQSRTTPEDGLTIVQQITHTLDDHGIVAMGFVVGGQLRDETIPAVQAFADAGHTIGNHSWSHPDYGTLSPREFRDETAQTDHAISQWLTGPRYYRFPYLKEGETEAAKEAATDVLTDLGYQNVPVTIDNDDWRYNRDYMDALGEGDAAGAEQIAAQYVAHMQERSVHFRQLARTEFGRDVSHILLIHMNRINADHLDTLLDWYAAQGWTFVTVQDAMSDPFYAADDIYVGPRGLSQIERVLGRASD